MSDEAATAAWGPSGTTLAGPPPPGGGLSEDEAARRLAAAGPREGPASSRSWASIVRANLLTVFNVTLLVFGLVTLAFGDWRDALFLAILALNAGIGIVQEARAKRSLDRLAALVAPRARVVRDGRERPVGAEEVVQGDLVRLGPGDGVVADGRVEEAAGLELDESILTGEAEPVARGAGAPVRAGTFAVEGSGAYVATAVGPQSFAERLAGEAREVRHPRSPLEQALDRLIIVLAVTMVPLALLLGWSLLEQDAGVREAVSTAVAGVVTIIPEGLVLLTGLTFAVAALRMTRRGALTQQLSAVESLASADVVCLDKTGTLTEDALRVVALVPAPGVGEEELGRELAWVAASAPAPNATLRAIAEAHPGRPETVEASVAFSSRRRWSGVRASGRTRVLAAPERLPLKGLVARAREEAAAGRRVLALAAGDLPLAPPGPDDGPPAGLRVLGLVVLAERLRPDARETVAFLQEQGVALTVISGDDPATVAAIAADAGIAMRGGVADGRELPEDPGELADLAERVGAVGRISPEGKRRLVEALGRRGHHVAMVGDGVNDVPALKAARLAIAQGTGAQMARSVADVVLVSGGFSALPPMIREGRKVLRNLQRVAKLFVAKSALAGFLILTVGLSSDSYPFLPRHLTLASAITIGIPAFFLALAPSDGPWRPDRFLRELSSFAVPAGIAAGLGVVASYLVALNLLDVGEVRARTTATTALVGIGLYLVLLLESSSRRRSWTVGALCAALAALYLTALALPGPRGFFEVSSPDAAVLILGLAGAGLAAAGLWLTDERFVPGRAGPRAAPAG